FSECIKMFHRPKARCENGMINMKCEAKICKWVSVAPCSRRALQYRVIALMLNLTFFI
ncbi:unnamed protein product, partial [Bubo scandiacus]